MSIQKDNIVKIKDSYKNSLFHNTKKFLQSYRKIELFLYRAKTKQMERLIANDMNLQWEQREDDIEFNEMLLKEAVSALHYVKLIPKMGRIWYYILRIKYFDAKTYQLNDDEIIKKLYDAKVCGNISKTTYYRYQKSAIITYGEILWGALDRNSVAFKHFMKMAYDS